MPRISVAALAGVIALAGLSLGCLLYASSPWAAMAPIAYYAALGFAPIAIIHRTRWPFFLGFTAWAWGYAYLTSSYQTPLFRQRLPTVRFLEWAYTNVVPEGRKSGSFFVTVEVPLASLKDDRQLDGAKNPFYVRFEGEQAMEAHRIAEENWFGREYLSSRPLQTPNEPRMYLRVRPNDAHYLVKGLAAEKKLSIVPPPTGISVFLSAPPLDRDSFWEVGHSLFGLLLGLTGGLLGVRFYRTRET